MIKNWFGLTKTRLRPVNNAKDKAERALLRKNEPRQKEFRQIADIQYQLIRSAKRKTLGLQVKNAKVVVRAPYFVCESSINTFISHKSCWLKDKIAEQQVALKKVPLSIFRQDGEILIHGELKTIDLVFSHKNSVAIEESFLKVTFPFAADKLSSDELKTKIKRNIELWLKEQCDLYIKAKLPELSEHCRLTPKSYKIRRYKARWGSCNSNQELSFNYLLMLCPTWVIDYVIIHELCHIEEMNHSKRFWQLVEQHCAEYKMAKEWFTKNREKLHWY